MSLKIVDPDFVKKTTPKKRTRQRFQEDVCVKTSLPPHVEGPVHSLLILHIPKLRWHSKQPPCGIAHVKVNWWGEENSSSIFRPQIVNAIPDHRQKPCTTAKYYIRSEMKQFSKYLTDAAELVLKILDSDTNRLLGIVKVQHLSTLNINNPIKGYLPIFTTKGEKLGDLFVTIRIILPGTNDSNDHLVWSSSDVSNPVSRRNSIGGNENNQGGLIDNGMRTFTLDRAYSADCLNSSSNATTIIQRSNLNHNTNRTETAPSRANTKVNLQKQQETLEHKNLPADTVVEALIERAKRLREDIVKSSLNKDKDVSTDTNVIDISSEKTRTNNALLTANSLAMLSSHDDNQRTAYDLLGIKTVAKTTHESTESILSDLDGLEYEQGLLDDLLYGTNVKTDSDLMSLSFNNEHQQHQLTRSSKTNMKIIHGRPPTGRQARSPNPNGARISRGLNSCSPSGSRSRSVARSTDSDSASKVSFDMPNSDVESSGNESLNGDGLSAERIRLLGHVRTARIKIDRLCLNALSTAARNGGRESPTHVSFGRTTNTAKKATTYFVEYQFPVIVNSRDGHINGATEVIKIASKRFESNNDIIFNHFSSYPVLLNSDTLKNWWRSLLIFKIYSRLPGINSPAQIGFCVLPLRDVLKAEYLHIEENLKVIDRTQLKINNKIPNKISKKFLIGNLKLMLELNSDSKDFKYELDRTRLQEKLNPNKKLLSICSPTKQKSLTKKSSKKKLTIINDDLILPKAFESKGFINNSESQEFDGTMTMNGQATVVQILVSIPEARNITQTVPTNGSSKNSPRNPYCVCRMFWNDGPLTSIVCWGTSTPRFNFEQRTPVLLSTSTLEKMYQNFLIIEVWDKKMSSPADKLIGIVKVSLQQFYTSFKDKRISHVLLRSQYPILGVDSWLPIIDPFTGILSGELKILLAVGSTEQVTTLQMQCGDNNIQTKIPNSNMAMSNVNNNTQYIGHSGPFDMIDLNSQSVEHQFEIMIEGINGLRAFESLIWGESDCFIQYHFPVQIDKQQSSNSKTISGLTDNRNRLAFQMRVNRTAATLCTSDPTFHDCGKFRYILSPSEALHKPFFAAYQSVPSFEASIPFEVWTRFYYPNIRDQLLAKGKLSASKLCSMTTMLINTDDKAIQSFRIPLEIVQDENHNEQHYISSSSASYGGDLLVTVTYRRNIIRLDERQFKQAIVDRIGGSQVCLSVGIIRACGLKYAAKLQSRHDSRLSYPSQVGVNTYAKLSLSFLSDTESRVTRTVARSFVPEFNHSIDFPLPLIWSDKGNDSISLAEMLEHGELKIDLYHQITSNSNENPTSHSSVTSSAIIANPPPSTIITRTNGLVSRQKNEIQLSDVHLCYCTISLRELLAKNTGIKGWYPLSNPSRTANDQTSTTMSSIDSAENCVGGLELFVRFAQQDDRRRVIDFAKTVGWLADNYMDEEHFLDDQKDLGCLLTVSIDRIQFPIHLATRPGKDRIDERISVFVQYRLYDKMPIITKRKKPIIDKHYVSCELKFNKEHLFLCSSPFIWYLREEKFEIQIWTSENDHYEQAQSSTDKLIGSIYIDLNSLCDRKRKTHRLSAILPMFKNGTKDLAGSYVQTHITIDKSKDFNELRSYSASSSNDTEIDSYLENRHLHLILPDNNQLPMNRALHTITNNVFSVIINIEQAAHLPNVYSKTENEDVLPNPYVTYGTANSGHLYKTNVLNKTCKPMWNYQQQVKLSIEHLFNEKKNFILKVWHKINADIESIPEKSGDKVLGFVSIDLSPLLSGMQHISGWYNIIDMIGNVQGQLKITVIPQEDLLGLKRYKYTNYNYFNNRQKLDSSRSTATSATTTTGLNFMADLSARSGHICSSNSSTIQNNDDETNKQSLLMTNLRRQLGELDVITERLKARCYAGSDVSSETGRSSVPPPSEQNSMIGRQSDLNLQYRSHSATSKSQHQQLPSSCTKSTFDIDISEHFPESLNGKPLISNGLNVTDVLTLHNDQVRLAQQLMSKANHLLETSKDFFTTADMNVQLSNLNKNTNDNSNNQRTDHPMKASLKTNFNMTSEFQVPELDDEKLVILPITEHRQSPPLARQRLTTTTIKTSNIGIDERVNSFEHNYSPTTIISNGQLNHTSQTNNENENDLNNQAHWPIEILPDRIKTASSNIEQQAYSTITLPLTKRNKNNYNDGGGGNDDKHNDTVNIQPLNDLSAFNFDWNKMNVQRLNDITSFYRTDHIQTSVLVNDTSPLLNHQNFSITKEEIAILSPRATTITHTVVSTHDRIPKNNTLHRTSSSSSSPRLSSTVTVLPSQTNKEHEKIIPVRTIQRSTSPRSSSSVPPTSRTEEKSHQSLNPDTNCINANWIEEQKEQQDRLRKKQQQKQKSNEDQSKSTSRSPYLSFLDHPLPNFFPPNHKMKASMKQVSQALAVNHTNASDNRNELSSSSVMKTIQRIRTKSSTEILRGASPLETQQQQTKRLEKIFKTKYTTSS